MHVYFSGIGGAGIGPLALIAKQAGYEVSGSDAKDSSYIDYLRQRGINDIHIGQDGSHLLEVHKQKPVDWLVYSSALPKTNPNHPELKLAKEQGIKATKRDEFLGRVIKDKDLNLIAVSGTHGKTTTTAMAIWLLKQTGTPLSYSVGAKLSFGDMGHFDPASKYFIYEADEYDRNFLSFYPDTSLVVGVDWDHPDIYQTRESYYEAFREFIEQSSHIVLWQDDAEKLGLDAAANLKILDNKDPLIDQDMKLAGRVNRQDAWLVAHGLKTLLNKPLDELMEILNSFPGVSRRFEQIAPNIYTDYAHTPPKIRGALQLAHEVAGDNVVVVYEGLHNTRQHFIKDELANLFDGVKKLYIVPSYLAREDKSLELLTPQKLISLLSDSSKHNAESAELNKDLAEQLKKHADSGDLVLCFSAGGANSLDEWLRAEFTP